jgi:hypothetical protein
MSSTRRFRRVALIAIGGLLLNAATPLIADAAAALRGVPTGEVCDVWGVPIPHVAAPMAHEMAMAPSDDDTMSMSMSDHGATSADMEMPSDDATAVASARAHDQAAVPEPATPAHEHSHSHEGHGGHDGCEHCALTAFATFAAIDAFPAALPAPLSETHLDARPFRADATPYDAVTSWVLHLKRGPPRTA